MEGSVTQLGLNNYLINRKGDSVSFFKHGYQNYSNFVKDTRKINFKNNFSFGKTSTLRMDKDAKYGDLITNMIIEIDLPTLSDTNSGGTVGYCNGIGNALVKSVELKIGGNTIDKQYGEWMDIWTQLSNKPGLVSTYNRMIQKYSFHDSETFRGGKVFVPLQFWFCQNNNYNNTGLVLPLAALKDNYIELVVEIREFKDLYISSDGEAPIGVNSYKISDANLLVDFVTLDEIERRKMQTQKRQIFLMSQLQFLGEVSLGQNTLEKTISMEDFKYPITELVWVVRRDDTTTTKDYFNYSHTLSNNGRLDPITYTRISFEGRDRVPELSSEYFRMVEPYKVHGNVPNTFIHVYSFALMPENISQPSGLADFSGLQEPQMHIKFRSSLSESNLLLYAINYNVLQIDDKGNAWLLHSMSKGTPNAFPDENSATPQDCYGGATMYKDIMKNERSQIPEEIPRSGLGSINDNTVNFGLNERLENNK